MADELRSWGSLGSEAELPRHIAAPDPEPAPPVSSDSVGPVKPDDTSTIHAVMDAAADTRELPVVAAVPVLHSWAPTSATVVRQTKKHRDRRRRATLMLVVMVGALIAALMVTGVGVYRALQPPGFLEAGMPAADMQASADQAPVGPDGNDSVPVSNAEASSAGLITRMGVPQMGDMSVFVPALGIYAPLTVTQSFVPGEFPGFESLAIPANPAWATWYGGGAPLVGGSKDHGSTTIASHVTNLGRQGAFFTLKDVQMGNTVWTKDAEGKYQRWQTDRVYRTLHKDFPQQYWCGSDDTDKRPACKDNPRQLVLVTCGGPIVGNYYKYNIFVVAHQVNEDGSKQ